MGGRLDSLTAAEIKLAAELLSRLQPGFLPTGIFMQIARLTVLTIVEVVPLRLNADGQVEVLLIERPSDDPVWPGQLHTPGTVVLADQGEAGIDKGLERIRVKELKGVPTSPPVFVEYRLHRSLRGMEHAKIHWCEIGGEPRVGQFFLAAQLPADTLASQIDFIKKAADAYLTVKRTKSS